MLTEEQLGSVKPIIFEPNRLFQTLSRLKPRPRVTSFKPRGFVDLCPFNVLSEHFFDESRNLFKTKLEKSKINIPLKKSYLGEIKPV